MNWDISIGHCKQVYGRALQSWGQRFDRRSLVLAGEQIEYSGRLQSRYGMLKHHVQWGATLVRAPHDPAVPRDSLRMAKRIASGL